MLLVLLIHLLLCTYSHIPSSSDQDLEANVKVWRDSLDTKLMNHDSVRLSHPSLTGTTSSPLPRWFRVIHPKKRQFRKDVPSQLVEGSKERQTDAPFNCTVSKSTPAFIICVHQKELDRFISASLLSTGVWEPYVTLAFQKALKWHPEAAVVDLGANIGYYTLLASAMGHSVVAVEPHGENVRRLSAAAAISEDEEFDFLNFNEANKKNTIGNTDALLFGPEAWIHEKQFGDRTEESHEVLNSNSRKEEDILTTTSKTSRPQLTSSTSADRRGKILLLANAVSDGHRNVSLSLSPDNQGGVRVVEEGCVDHRPVWSLVRWLPSATLAKSVEKGCNVPTLTLDDLLYAIQAKTAIIKIDIEGYECRALESARRFFSTIQVPYVLMEWRQMAERQHQRLTHCNPGQIQAMASFFADRGYVPHEVRSGVALNPHRATSWQVGDIYWRAAGQPLLVPSW